VAGRMGLPCCALLTRMDQPLGWAVGNALEVQESIEVLRNERSPVSADFQSSDLREITLQLCAQMLLLGGVCAHLDQARTLAEGRLRDGSAWKVFQNMVRLQGGSLEQVLDPSRLPQAPRQYVWTAKKQGYISRMDTEVLGRILVELGGGRKRASDSVDPSVGMAFHRKLGAKINPGDPIATVHAPEMFSGMDALERAFDDAVGITEARRPVPKLIVGQVRQAEELAGGTAFSPGRVRTQSGA